MTTHHIVTSTLEAERDRLAQQLGEATARIETDARLIALLEAERNRQRMFEAGAMSLAIFWPTRPPGMCAVSLLRSEEGTAVRAAAREVLIAALRQESGEDALDHLGCELGVAKRKLLDGACY